MTSKNTKRILDNFEREQKQLSIKNNNNYKERQRINKFLQYEFNERYLFKSVLIIVPLTIALCYWIVYGNTFNNGFLRFLIVFGGMTLAVIVIKTIIFFKINEEFKLEVKNEN